MKTLLVLAFASVAFPQSGPPNVTNARFETRAFSGDLSAQLRAAGPASVGPAWFGYAVSSLQKENENCCSNNESCGCSLEGNRSDRPAAKSSQPVPLEGSNAIAILFRVNNNTVEKIRGFSLACPLDAGGLPFIWLTGVPA
ncbi:MAG: hypothetical protein JO270_11665, partial [Acidobacteriaceae bacterium]|nr:hypothetical protein [Acidobacteriaceae bacterium]